MENLIQLADTPAVAGLRVGVWVCEGRGGGIHIGVLYRAGLHLRVLDFEGIGRLGGGDVFPRRAGDWAVPLALDEYRAQFVQAIASRIWRRRERLPYGLRFVDTTFDRRGRFVLGSGASGLTCATFVMAVFRSAGIELLDRTDWPIRHQDVAWQSGLVYRMNKLLEKGQGGVTLRQVHALQSEVGCQRFRPEEVAAAAAGPHYPLGFREASRAGKALAEWVWENSEVEEWDFESGLRA